MTIVAVAGCATALGAIGLVFYLVQKMAAVYHDRAIAQMETSDARAQLKLIDQERQALVEALKRKEAELGASHDVRKRIERERDVAVQKLIQARPGASTAGINSELRRIADLGKTPAPAPLPSDRDRQGAVHGAPGSPGVPGDKGPGRK